MLCGRCSAEAEHKCGERCGHAAMRCWRPETARAEAAHGVQAPLGSGGCEHTCLSSIHHCASCDGVRMDAATAPLLAAGSVVMP